MFWASDTMTALHHQAPLHQCLQHVRWDLNMWRTVMSRLLLWEGNSICEGWHLPHRKNKACHQCSQCRCREISRWDSAANGHLSTVWDWTLFSKMTIPPPPQRRVYQRLPPDFGSGEDEMADLPSWPHPWSQKPVSGMFAGSAWAIMANITLGDLGQMLIEEQDAIPK